MPEKDTPLDLPTHSLTLRDFLDSLQTHLADFKDSSSEKYQHLKTNLPIAWKNRQETIEHYKKTLSDFPKELRRRDFVKNCHKEIETLELEFQQFMADIKELSFQEYCQKVSEQKLEYPHLSAMAVRIQNIKLQVEELEHNTLVQKFMRGEPILGSHKNIQWARKIGHMSFGVAFTYLFLFSGISKTVFWTFTSLFIIWAFSLETARHYNPRVNDWVCKWFKPVMREDEKEKVNSAIFYIASILVVYAIFPLPITIMTLLFLALGDTAAGVVGVYFGKTKLSAHASLEGFLACFGTCAVICTLGTPVLFNHPQGFFQLLFFSILGGLTGALAESSFKKLDDNLVMPLLSAPALWILMKIFVTY